MHLISKKLRLLRLERNWTQEDVARRLDISIPAYSKIEGGLTDVNLSRLEELAKVFDLSVIELLASEDQPPATRELETLNNRLADREKEVMDLQQKVIELFEKLRKNKTA
ncbi:MAG TPA: helix-turn-helix transcriptional regulator [Mucilaginibacter sp.]|nr:helix-turn-helix transcriptional regulator [Mucilaginibacter sp.]